MSTPPATGATPTPVTPTPTPSTMPTTPSTTPATPSSSTPATPTGFSKYSFTNTYLPNYKVNIDAGKTSTSQSLGSGSATDVGIFDTGLAPDTIKSLFDASSYNASNMIFASIAVADLQNGTSGPRYTSSQILVEPLKSISHDSIANSNIGATATTAQSTIPMATTQVAMTSALGSKGTTANDKKLQKSLCDSAAKAGTVARTQAEKVALANGGHFTVAYGARIDAANSITNYSDTTHVTRSPHILHNSQDHHIVANNSYVVNSDAVVAIAVNSAQFTEGSHLHQSTSTTHVSTDTHDAIANEATHVGVTSFTTIGATNNLYADTLINQVSAGDISHAAYGSITHRATGDISILAHPGSTVTDQPPSASGDPAGQVLGAGIAQFGSITLSSSSTTTGGPTGTAQGASNVMSLNKDGSILSTTGANVSTSAGMNVTSGAMGAVLTTGPSGFAYMGGQNGGMLFKGRRLFLNSIPIPISDVPYPQIDDIPSLPILQQLPNPQLQNCIPDKYKKGTFPSGDVTGASQTILDSNDTVLTSGTSSIDTQYPVVDASNTITYPSIPASVSTKSKTGKVSTATNSKDASLAPSKASIQTNNKNKKNKPRNLNTKTNVKANLSGDTNASKLPGITPNANSPDTPTSAGKAAADTMAMSGAGTNIYIDKYGDQLAMFQSMQTNQLDSANLFGLLNSNLNDACTAKGIAALSNNQFTGNKILNITSEIVSTALKSNLKAALVTSYNDINLFTPLLGLTLDQQTSLNISASDLKALGVTDANSTKLLQLLSIPGGKTAIQSILKAATALPAIGSILSSVGLGGIGGLISTIQGYGSTALQIPKVIQSNNVSTIYGFFQPLASKLLAGTSIGNLINNPDIQSLGQALTSGSDIGQYLITTAEAKIQGILTNSLGSQFGSLVPSLTTFIMTLQSGKPISEDSIISTIQTIANAGGFGSDVTTATKIYTDSESVIKSWTNGDILQFVTGSSFQTLMGDLLGPTNSKILGDSLGLVKNIVGTVQAIALVPDLINLMNSYNIPGLSQINIALSCLGLKEKVQSLLDSIGALNSDLASSGTPGTSLVGPNQQAAALLDVLPMLTQAVNSINSDTTTPTSTDTSTTSDGSTIPTSITNIQVPQYLDACFRIPRLTLSEAQLTIVSQTSDNLVFSVTNLAILLQSSKLIPGKGYELVMMIDSFQWNGKSLYPFQTEYSYTSLNYTYTITSFDMNANQGTAVIQDNAPIVLVAGDGTLLSFRSSDIGDSLIPHVLSTYILG